MNLLLKNHIGIWLFLTTLILNIYFIDYTPNWNTSSRAALPLSLALKSKLSIEEYAHFTGDEAVINNKPYSDKSPLSGLLLTPILKIIDLVFDLDELSSKRQLEVSIYIGSILFSAIPFALMVLLTFKNGLQNNKDAIIILFLSFFGSFMFAFSGAYWSHVFTTFLIILSYRYFIKSNFILSGLFIGAGFMNEYSVAIFGLVWGFWVLYNKKWNAFILFSIGTLPFIIAQLIYNYLITGSILSFAYQFQPNFTQNAEAFGFTFPSLYSIFHLSISTYRGLFFYAPALIIIVFIIINTFKKNTLTSLQKILILSCIIYFIVISSSKSWYAGWTYGPRYLMVICGLLFYTFLPLVKLNSKRIKYSFFALTISGLILSFINKFTVLYPKTESFFPLVDEHLPNLLHGRINNNHIFSIYNFEGYLPLIIFIFLFISVLVLVKKIHQNSINNV